MEEGYILGVNISRHNASAAIVKSGKLIALIQQDKLDNENTKFDHTPGMAVKQCLAQAGIGIESITQVAIGRNPSLCCKGKMIRYSPQQLTQILFSGLEVCPVHAAQMVWRVHWVNHPLAHAASAFYSCGDEQAAIIVADGFGAGATMVARGSHNGIEVLRQYPTDQSLGMYFASAARWCGFGDYGSDQLMALASYGRPYEDPALITTEHGFEISVQGKPLRADAIQHAGEGSSDRFAQQLVFDAALAPAFAEIFPYRRRAGEDVILYADFASTVQNALESAMLSLAEATRRKTQRGTLALAGGVAMNSSMVGRLLQTGIFDRVYVPPVPNNAGIALGAALVCSKRQHAFFPHYLTHSYWSTQLRSANDEEVVAQLIRCEGLFAHSVVPEQIPAITARAIATGKIVAWARGRAEIGARSLGARSIIFDPRARSSLVRINQLKGRPSWRPVGLSVLKEDYAQIFLGEGDDPMRFMLAADIVRNPLRKLLQATTHVDATALPHIVDAADNPYYWAMIARFKSITGIPLVANTSFKGLSSPMVATAPQAIQTFATLGLDLLVLDDLLVSKRRSTIMECISQTHRVAV